MKRILFIVLFSIGCEDIQEEPTEIINLNMELPTNENGDYYFTYPTNQTNSYTRVLVETNRENGRVFFTSPDSFEYIYQGILFRECVVNYSIYCLDETDGLYHGQQLIYLNENMVGDTIDIYGYYTEDIIGYTRFIIY